MTGRLALTGNTINFRLWYSCKIKVLMNLFQQLQNKTLLRMCLYTVLNANFIRDLRFLLCSNVYIFLNDTYFSRFYINFSLINHYLIFSYFTLIMLIISRPFSEILDSKVGFLLTHTTVFPLTDSYIRSSTLNAIDIREMISL